MASIGVRYRASRGGYGRAAKLSAEERSVIARKAVQARWQMTAAEREARRQMMAPVEVEDLTLEACGDRLRLTIAEHQPTTTLTAAGVTALLKEVQRWRRWLARKKREKDGGPVESEPGTA